MQCVRASVLHDSLYLRLLLKLLLLIVDDLASWIHNVQQLDPGFFRVLLFPDAAMLSPY